MWHWNPQFQITFPFQLHCLQCSCVNPSFNKLNWNPKSLGWKHRIFLLEWIRLWKKASQSYGRFQSKKQEVSSQIRRDFFKHVVSVELYVESYLSPKSICLNADLGESLPTEDCVMHKYVWELLSTLYKSMTVSVGQEHQLQADRGRSSLFFLSLCLWHWQHSSLLCLQWQ